MCLGKISEHSKNWTNTDPLRDFTSTAWTDLEQQGATAFVAVDVAIAQDLQSEDQMRSARTALQDVAMDTADHLGLLIQVNEQIHIHEQALTQWMMVHSNEDWFSLKNYRGLDWTNGERNDNWPDFEYHEYQTIQSGLDSEQCTRAWELPKVQALVPQFWAHAQVVAKSWHTFTTGLHSHDDEWNQNVSKQIHNVCQMMKTAKMLPSDYDPWYAFMKAWIEDFSATRIKLLASMAVSGEVVSSGCARQGEAG